MNMSHIRFVYGSHDGCQSAVCQVPNVKAVVLPLGTNIKYRQTRSEYLSIETAIQGQRLFMQHEDAPGMLGKRLNLQARLAGKLFAAGSSCPGWTVRLFRY